MDLLVLLQGEFLCKTYIDNYLYNERICMLSMKYIYNFHMNIYELLQ